MSGVADLGRVVEEARRHRDQGTRTVVLIDEIHRFNKAQQDALLPHVEEGLITLVGATTENPYFEIIGPLLSRAKIFIFEPLTAEDVPPSSRGPLQTQTGVWGPASPRSPGRPWTTWRPWPGGTPAGP